MICSIRCMMARSSQSTRARLAFSTDSYVVSPIFFPGGSIGTLAVHGTVNDLAMCGARPLYLSAGFTLEGARRFEISGGLFNRCGKRQTLPECAS
jgi:hydrogenase maturation factor